MNKRDWHTVWLFIVALVLGFEIGWGHAHSSGLGVQHKEKSHFINF